MTPALAEEAAVAIEAEKTTAAKPMRAALLPSPASFGSTDRAFWALIERSFMEEAERGAADGVEVETSLMLAMDEAEMAWLQANTLEFTAAISSNR